MGVISNSGCLICDKIKQKNFRRKHRVRLQKYHRDWDKKLSPEKRKEYILKSNFNMTLQDFKVISRKQRNKCAICQKNCKLQVDHDHKTNKIRGLLCMHCNVGIGNLHDSVRLLKRATRYLVLHKD